jgi:hypothetical protein
MVSALVFVSAAVLELVLGSVWRWVLARASATAILSATALG